MSKKEEKTYWNEEWKPLKKEGFNPRGGYLISNYGRVKSFSHNRKIPKLLKHSVIKGTPYIVLRDKDGKPFTMLIGEVVARHFLPKNKKADSTKIIYKDFNRGNNYFKNVAWASKDERREHIRKDPNYQPKKGIRRYSKLTESQVRLIKKKLNDPTRKTRVKMLAKQFGISEMQLYRIKAGKNWSDIE